MPGKSQSHTDALLNVLRGSALAGVAPCVGLFSVAPADDASASTELAGNGYQRQAITFGAPATDAGNAQKVANTNNIQFGPALAEWLEAVAFGVFDAQTNGTCSIGTCSPLRRPSSRMTTASSGSGRWLLRRTKAWPTT